MRLMDVDECKTPEFINVFLLRLTEACDFARWMGPLAGLKKNRARGGIGSQ